jgi:hypothetical protein
VFLPTTNSPLAIQTAEEFATSFWAIFIRVDPVILSEIF